MTPPPLARALVGPPSPGDDALLVYDADCGFCTRTVERAVRHVRPRVVPVPSFRVDLAACGLTQARVDHEMVLVRPDGSTRGGALAAAGVLRRAQGSTRACWVVVGLVLGLPPVRWLAAPLYRAVARNRHRMPGATAACRITPAGPPDPMAAPAVRTPARRTS
ncbi:MAG: DUF393 domain-containing protein [Cellulomonas sp.]|uniref:thiol-disulfide oxidoreductase DCC family protein n=1 Tax=Cellulomonas sp. TaxID=40001 RepID=UPI0019EEAE5A|nr:DCC1-like thiol-disulfide oxidoreductase family protein [Cellulomonas sp.]MBF0688248.1 DUF393 domain-containing protein [Cellulomonas sp.]